jgi:hypothetical protein
VRDLTAMRAMQVGRFDVAADDLRVPPTPEGAALLVSSW